MRLTISYRLHACCDRGAKTTKKELKSQAEICVYKKKISCVKLRGTTMRAILIMEPLHLTTTILSRIVYTQHFE